MHEWTDAGDGREAAAYTEACIDLFGDGDAFRGLYADALEMLAPDADIGGGQADRMAAIAEVGPTGIDSPRRRSRPQTALNEAASVLEEIVERETAFFEHVREAL